LADARKTWTAEEEALARRAAAQGKSARWIGEQMGRSSSSVGKHMTAVGWQEPPTEIFEKKLRKCLGEDCGKMFMSEHSMNRKCKYCRTKT
jgi:hypothetical protein